MSSIIVCPNFSIFVVKTECKHGNLSAVAALVISEHSCRRSGQTNDDSLILGVVDVPIQILDSLSVPVHLLDIGFPVLVKSSVDSVEILLEEIQWHPESTIASLIVVIQCVFGMLSPF